MGLLTLLIALIIGSGGTYLFTGAAKAYENCPKIKNLEDRAKKKDADDWKVINKKIEDLDKENADQNHKIDDIHRYTKAMYKAMVEKEGGLYVDPN
jgi:guanylate kinase